VDLSPLLFHLFKIRDWLWRAKSKTISKYLWDEMIFAFSLTNNRYRFHLFCVRFLKQWRRTGEIPISKHSTFVGNFLCFLYQQYGSCGGNSTKAGHTEGSVRFQCPANLPLTKLAKFQSMQNMTHTFDDMDSRGVTEVKFKNVVKLLNNGLANSGNLLNQKSIYAVSGCGRVTSPNWAQYSIPGSSLHQKRLSEAPSFFQRPDQIRQLAHCLAARGDRNGRMNGAKVDEVMCKTLKPHSSDTRFNDVVIKGCDLYFPSNEESNLRMMRVRAETGTTEHVVTRGFESAPYAHYIPKWSEQNDPYEYSGLEVYMASEKNYEFNVKKQSEAKLVKVHILSLESRFEYGDVQTLLNKNHFLAMKEPICCRLSWHRTPATSQSNVYIPNGLGWLAGNSQ
jgi:hypothetical protein